MSVALCACNGCRWEACSVDSELPDAPLSAALRFAAAAQPSRPPARPKAHPSSAAAAAAAAVAEATTTGTHGHSMAHFCAATAEDATSKPSGIGAARATSAAVKQGVSGPPATLRPPMVGSTPVHTIARYSYLSSDGVWTAKHDGLLNLGIIILVATNFRSGLMLLYASVSQMYCCFVCLNEKHRVSMP